MHVGSAEASSHGAETTATPTTTNSSPKEKVYELFFTKDGFVEAVNLMFTWECMSGKLFDEGDKCHRAFPLLDASVCLLIVLGCCCCLPCYCCCMARRK